MADDGGRPATTDEQYQEWLDAMAPFLKNGCSPYYAISQAGLIAHKDIIYRKYRLNDWFREKIEQFRQEPGELVNDTIVKLIRNISDKAKRGELITGEETKILTFYAEKSRAAQPFYVSRTEVANVKPLDDVIEAIEAKNESDDDVAREAEKQVVAAEQPISHKEQAGDNNSVPAESDPAKT